MFKKILVNYGANQIKKVLPAALHEAIDLLVAYCLADGNCSLYKTLREVVIVVMRYLAKLTETKKDDMFVDFIEAEFKKLKKAEELENKGGK